VLEISSSLRGFGPLANYADRATAASSRSSTNFCGWRVLRGERSGSPRSYSRFSWPELFTRCEHYHPVHRFQKKLLPSTLEMQAPGFVSVYQTAYPYITEDHNYNTFTVTPLCWGFHLLDQSFFQETWILNLYLEQKWNGANWNQHLSYIATLLNFSSYSFKVSLHLDDSSLRKWRLYTQWQQPVTWQDHRWHTVNLTHPVSWDKVRMLI
jgi:hypothetical protein